MNGALVDWQDATVHVGTHALHYGTAIFEGIRAYQTRGGSAVCSALPGPSLVSHHAAVPPTRPEPSRSRMRLNKPSLTITTAPLRAAGDSVPTVRRSGHGREKAAASST